MELKLDSVLIGRIMAGVVIFLAVVSAIVGAAGARSGGFDLFLARLLLPLGVGVLIIAATAALKAVLDRRGEAGLPLAGAQGDGAGERARIVTSNRAGEAAKGAALQGLGMLSANLRLNAANIGSSLAGLFVVISLFIPWVIFLVTYDDEWESTSYTLLGAANTLEIAQPRVWFGILLVLGLLSIASMALPRAVSAIIAFAGFLVTTFSWLYLFGEQLFAKALLGDWVPPGVGAATFPYLGALLASFCFLVIFLLQLIPGLNRSRGRG